MSELTSNYNLIKPQAADPIDLLMTNPNWDIIDEKLSESEEKISNLTNTIDLGCIYDHASYDEEVGDDSVLNTIVEEGLYTWHDEEFSYFLEVKKYEAINDTIDIVQKYWSQEELALQEYTRTIRTRYNGDIVLITNWDTHATFHDVELATETLLPLSGGRMSGEIDMSGNDILNISNANFSAQNADGDNVSVLNLQPVLSEEDNSVYLYLQDEYNGFHTVGIQNVADPIESTDAATKGYVDELKPNEVTGSGSITVTIANNTVYEYTGVTTLNMTGNTNEAYGFVTFGSSAPSVTVSGFTGSSGDDITSAAASQVWEFNCSKGRIIWKNWSA